MAFCTECGFKLPEEALFCPNCGAAHSPATDKIKEEPVAVQPAQDSTDSTAFEPMQPEAEPKIPQQPIVEGFAENTGSAPAYSPAAPSGIPTPPSPNKSGWSGTKITIVVCSIVLGVALLAGGAYWAFSQFIKGWEKLGNAIESSMPYDEPEFTQQPATGSVLGSGYVGDGLYYISINGAEKYEDVNGSPALRIFYTFTNNFDYPVEAWNVLQLDAVQDGEDLEVTYFWDEAQEDFNDGLKIRTGVTVQCCYAVVYDPNGGVVDFKVSAYDSSQGTGRVIASFDPADLPGVPIISGIAPVSDPQWTMQIPDSGIIDEDYFISVDKAEMVEDDEYGSCIRVYYSFTNKDDEPNSMYMAVTPYAYQDGVGLRNTLAERIETDSDFYQDVAPGKTLVVSCLFKLRSSSPVEAEVESDEYYNEVVGATFILD